MAKLDNPAGRLHTLLTAFGERAQGSNGSILGVWKAVFGTESDSETLLRVAEAANLLPETEYALERIGDQDQLDLFHTFAEGWLSVVLHPRYDLYSQLARGVLPEKQFVTSLGGVSAFLSAVASEGPVPEPPVMKDLADRVREVIDGLIADEDLSEEVKHLALEHAHRLQQALDHFRIGGPGAVREATERLVGSLKMAPEPVALTVWQRVGGVFQQAWQVFQKAPQFQQALEAAPEIVKMLPF